MYAKRFHRRRVRHTVWMTLLAWSFALAAGVVNACLLAPQGSVEPGAHGAQHRFVAHSGDARGMRLAEHGHHGDAASSPGPHPDAGQEGCLKFCDDGASALSKTKVASLDPGVQLLAAFSAWNASVSKLRLVTLQPLARPSAQGPPLVIRFLRLTL